MTVTTFTREIGALVEAHQRAEERLARQRAVEADRTQAERGCAERLKGLVEPVLAETVAELTRRHLQARVCASTHGDPGIALELAPRADPGSCSRVAFHCDPAGGLHVNVDACGQSGRHGWTENLTAAESTDERVRQEVLRFLKEVLAG